MCDRAVVRTWRQNLAASSDARYSVHPFSTRPRHRRFTSNRRRARPAPAAAAARPREPAPVRPGRHRRPLSVITLRKPASGHANSRQLAGSCRLTLCAGWLVAHPGNLRGRAEAVLIPGSVASRLPFSAALNQAVTAVV